jgi:hypothetical protein
MKQKISIAVITLLTAIIIGIGVTPILPLQQRVYAVHEDTGMMKKIITGPAGPIATSGDKNVYVVWPSNKTGNDDVMFKASTDGGKTFGNKMNISNSSKSESVNVQIAAAGSNVYVSWWERNQTSNEPVLRVSNDNGKTFGEMIMLSNNGTTAKP